MSTQYDLSCVPLPVQQALLQLTEAIVQASTSPGEESAPPPVVPAVQPAPRRHLIPGAVQACPRTTRQPRSQPRGNETAVAVMAKSKALPTAAGCPHGTARAPTCPDCTVIYNAELVVADAHNAAQQRFPRSDVELRILEALRQAFPMPLAPRQVAASVGLPKEKVMVILQCLLTLGTVERPSLGLYRHRPMS
jgi:hypothetical protein